jgi:hypothetical protein
VALWTPLSDFIQLEFILSHQTVPLDSASSTDTGHFLFAGKLDKAAPQKPHLKAYWVQKTGQEHT